MADHHHSNLHHHQQHRPNRLSLPPRTTTQTSLSTPTRPYPQYPPFTPTPTPSKHRLSASLKPYTKKSSLPYLLLLLFSLRSLYSLLPFLRSSSPSFSLFPFSFLVSLLSFLLSLSFSLLTTSSTKDPFFNKSKQQPIFSIYLITHSQRRLLVAKSVLLAVVFLLRFQALSYCGTAAMILAEFSGYVAARYVSEKSNSVNLNRNRYGRYVGFGALFSGLFLLSISWDRNNCFPLSYRNGYGLWGFDREKCVRFLPMLLPFLSGFLGFYERVSMNWGTIRQLGQKRVRLITLFFTTIALFIPAIISIMMFKAEGNGISTGSMSWPLANTVLFGVLLNEHYSDEKVVSPKDFQREFLVTFVCMIVLELFYFPELSLGGLLLCGFLLWVAVGELDPFCSSYVELGLDSSEPLSSSIMKPIRHILSERKSRKIALFLLINTGYMFVEFAAGFMSNSLGLISDACHMLFDCAALAIGLYASYISRLPANGQFNYGRGRFEVLSGYVNAVFLVLVGALIVLESIERILDPQEISTNSLLSVSIGGLLVNMVGLIFFHEEHHHAHGGSATCSHSHGHSYSHNHHSLDHLGHEHQAHHEQHLECVSISHDTHETSSATHDKTCTNHHGHHDCDHHDRASKYKEDQKDEGSECHGRHHHDSSHGHHHHDHNHGDHHQDHNHGHNHDHHELHEDHHHHDHEVHSKGSEVSLLGEPQKRHNHRHIDHNMEGIFLHVLADTMGSVGVVISTLLIKYKGWLVADPACSIFISILIVSSVIQLLRNSAEILLQRVPRAHEQDLREALRDVMKEKGVCGVQQLHVWSFTNTDVVGTLHIHVSAETDKTSAKTQVTQMFRDAGVKDLTVQVECVERS